MAGLWFVPPGEGPFPAAVVIRGSGPSTRDSYWDRAFVEVMLEEGVAVLLPDKRGSGGLEGDWRTADFEELAGDALAAVAFVRLRPEVRADAVGLLGLTNGRVDPPARPRQASPVRYSSGGSGRWGGSRASRQTRRISLATRAAGSMGLESRYQRSSSGAGIPCPFGRSTCGG